MSQKRKTLNRAPASFTYKSRHKEITGNDDNKHLLLLCYLDSLRWLIYPLLLLILAALHHWLSG
jgi:hypothetical protein